MSKKLKETSDRVWLAGLGALAVATQEGNDLFLQLVKKGREVEEGKKSSRPELWGKGVRVGAKLSDLAKEGVEVTTQSFGMASGPSQGFWYPQVEVSERDGNLVVCADLPGMKKEDVHLEIHDDFLILRGERRQEREQNEGGLYRSERSYGQFYRTVPLPEGASPGQAKATFKDGVLEVTVPLPQQHSPLEKFLPTTQEKTMIEARQARRLAAARRAFLKEFGGPDRPAVDWEPLQRERKIFTVTHRGATYVPSFQFDDEGRPRPAVASVIQILGKDTSDWGLALWFTAANGSLDDKRPVDLLSSHPEKVVQAAEQEAAELVF